MSIDWWLVLTYGGGIYKRNKSGKERTNEDRDWITKYIENGGTFRTSMRYCDSQLWMSTRLVAVCTKEQVPTFDKRQIPISIDENLIVKSQLR